MTPSSRYFLLLVALGALHAGCDQDAGVVEPCATAVDLLAPEQNGGQGDLADVAAAADLAPPHVPVWSVVTSPMPYWSVWGRSADDVFVGGSSALVLHSGDHGATWDEQRIAVDDSEIHGLWGSGADDVFATVDNFYGQSAVFRSQDGGRNWQARVLVQSDKIWSCWAIHGQARSVFCPAEGFDDAIFSSEDGGDNWTMIHVDRLVRNFVSAWSADDYHRWIGGNPGLFFSSDRGMTWSEQTPGGFDAVIESLWGTGPRDVYGVGGGWVIHTSDGTHWVPTAIDGGYFYAVNGTAENDVWIGGETAGPGPGRWFLLRSTNGGKTWRQQPGPQGWCPSGGCSIRGIWAAATDDVYVVGTSTAAWDSAGFIAHLH